MAYTFFDPAVPAVTQTGTAVPGAANSNDKALRDAILSGAVADFKYTQSGGTTEEPTTQYWRNGNGVGAIILRATNTWAGGYCTATAWALSTNSGGTYDTIATEGRTFDGNGNLTTTDAAGGIIAWFHQWVGKFKALRTAYNAHAVAGVAPHSLGNMALQAPGSVAITGGAIDATTVGVTTAALARFKQARSMHVSPALNGTTLTLDWAEAESFDYTNPNSTAKTLAFANLPAAGTFAAVTFELTNGGLCTWSWPANTKFVGGSQPALTSAGRDRLSFMTRSGSGLIDCLFAKGLA